jgi:tripartite-type tricarboxylate transporter receptor subunit TctC
MPSHQRRVIAKTIVTSSLASLVLRPTYSLAQTPSNAKIYVGFAAGGGSDLVSRLLAEKMRDSTGTQFIVENKTGAAGKLSVDALRQTNPDGSGLLLAPLVTPVLSQLMFKNPGYDPAKDLAPVGMVGYFQFTLAVGPKHPAKNIAEFVSWIKSNKDQATFGTPSPGSLPHFFGVMLGKTLGVDMTHVAYRGGAPMLADLMAGQIPCGIDTEPEMVELHKAGKIRVLATFGQRRSAILPDVPTMIESGFKETVGSAWYSLWTTAGTPAAVITKYNQALNSALKQADVQEKFKLWGIAAPSSPAELERIRLTDIEKWRPIVQASGFKAD